MVADLKAQMKRNFLICVNLKFAFIWDYLRESILFEKAFKQYHPERELHTPQEAGASSIPGTNHLQLKDAHVGRLYKCRVTYHFVI